MYSCVQVSEFTSKTVTVRCSFSAVLDVHMLPERQLVVWYEGFSQKSRRLDRSAGID